MSADTSDSSGYRAASTDGQRLFDDLSFTVERLVAPGMGCPSLAQRSAADYLRFVCMECDAALQELLHLASLGVESDVDPNQRASVQAALVVELGDVLYTVLVAVSKASQEYSVEPAAAYESAVVKIRGRTPYMPEWGDGSVAQTSAEAAAIWQARKAQEKAVTTVSGCACPPEESGRHSLWFTVERLNAPDGCAWTRSNSADMLLNCCKDECEEALQEIACLLGSSSEPSRRSANHVRGALVSELGDVLFCALMAVFLAAREQSLEVPDVIARAVQKIRWRTPYIPEWGDGSIAATAADAEAIWKARKAANVDTVRKGMRSRRTCTLSEAPELVEQSLAR